MSGRTRITCTDIDTGESESVEIERGQFLVVCGPDRYIAGEQVYANGTNVVTIKRHPSEEAARPVRVGDPGNMPSDGVT